jgi:tetratricopeptide (TPR) repeat protein
MSRIEELEKRLAADPNSRMFVQLAEEYRKAGLLEQAIDCCEKGLKKHPQYPSARVALGRALLEAGSFDRASAEFETVLKQVPDNILAHKFLGETYHRLGRLDEALKKYRVASTLAPEDTELGDRIQEVQAELAGGPRPAPAPAAPAAPPGPASTPPPAPSSPRPAASPPPPPAAASAESESTARMIDLPPIPLVEVDEPMVLEGRDYAPPPKAPASPAPAPPPRFSPPPAPAFTEIEPEPFLEPTIIEHGPASPPAASPPPRATSAPPASAPAAKPPLPQATSVPPAPAPAAKPAPPVAEIETPTMAEIYANQGHFDQALAVYRKIIERHPNDTQYRERVEELLMLSRAAKAPNEPPAPSGRRAADSFEADERTIRVLEDWLAAIRKSREG